MADTALQIELLSASEILAGNNVIFNSITYSTGSISYDLLTGAITITKIGRYFVNWWMATQTSTSNSGVGFTVTTSNGDLRNGSSPLRTGEVFGMGIIEIIVVPTTISLVNTGTNSVFVSANVPVKGSLAVLESDEIPGPTGPTGATGVTGPTGASASLTNFVDGNATGAVRGINAKTDYTMGTYAFAEGGQTVASGAYSHAEGFLTTASMDAAHAEGASTTSSAYYAHAEGSQTVASGQSAHAEGMGSIANINAAHAEGFNTTASGAYAHSEGAFTNADGAYSHTEGYSTSANTQAGAHIMGRFGISDEAYSWFLANGIDNLNLGLAAKIFYNGNAYIDVAWNTGGADYAELFETADGKSIEPGYFVTLDHTGQKICKMISTEDYILGVVSATAGVVGDAGELRWRGKYLTDEWGKILYNEATVPEITDTDGKVIVPKRTELQPILNPQWDNTAPYVPRLKRPEWVTVGLLGKLRVRDDGTCVAGGYCLPVAGGIATVSQTGYKVLSRLGEHQILILFR